MHHLHGVRLDPLYHEMDEYERIIHQFKKKAKNFHDYNLKKAKKNGGETEEERTKRLAERKAEFLHLKHEAAFAKTRAQVQARIIKLQNYRNHGLTHNQMLGEEYHPTDELEEMLRADGRPKPSYKHTAHHIVPGKGKTELAASARIELHLHNIRINDPDNGVWMIRLKEDKGHWSMKKANSHLEIHTHNYERWILTKLELADDEGEARGALFNIRNRLQNGTQPPEVTMPPDSAWGGNG